MGKRHGQRRGGGEQPASTATASATPPAASVAPEVAAKGLGDDLGADRDPAEAALETEDDDTGAGADAGDAGSGAGDGSTDASALPDDEGEEDAEDGDDPAGDDLDEDADRLADLRNTDEEDPELAAARPKLTLAEANALALQTSADLSRAIYDPPPGTAADDVMTAVFAGARKLGWSMPVETLYRQARSLGARLPPWPERLGDHETQLRIYIAVGKVLSEIADEQQAAYDQVAARLAAEAAAGKQRQHAARKRAKTAAKRDRRKAAMARATLQRRATRARAAHDATKGQR